MSVLTILKLSGNASILILFTIVLRTLFLHKLPARTFPVLWGVALLRLLIPVSIPSALSIFTWIQRITTPAPYSSAMPSISGQPHPLELLSPYLTVVWLAGCSVLGLLILTAHLRRLREYRMSIPAEDVFIAQWTAAHPLYRKVRIHYSDKIQTPLTYGICRPVILLPKAVYEPEKLSYILAHEWTHIRCFDTLAKWLLALTVCIHWFNPFVWIFYILACRDIEIACDKGVIHTLGREHKTDYALTLISMEEKRSRFAPMCTYFNKNSIEERIIAIMQIKKTTILSLSLAAVLVAGATAVFATSAMNTPIKPTPQVTATPAPQNISDGQVNAGGKKADAENAENESLRELPEHQINVDENQKNIENESVSTLREIPYSQAQTADAANEAFIENISEPESKNTANMQTDHTTIQYAAEEIQGAEKEFLKKIDEK